MKEVPNKFPKISAPYRLAIIGEAPGREEEIRGEPFVGASGRFLSALLSRVGVSRDACYIGNVCQIRPPDNDISRFRWDGEEIQSGLNQLAHDLIGFAPNSCLLLGNSALKAAKDCQTNHLLSAGKFKYSVSNWRGSVFIGDWGPMNSIKCLASYHPAAVLRNYEWAPILQFDIKKAYKEAFTKEYKVPERIICHELSVPEIVSRLDHIKVEKPLIALDIEGGIGTMSCISFATNEGNAFIVPLSRGAGNYWELESDERDIWRALSNVLTDPSIPKVLQNSLYDRFVLQYSYQIPVLGVVDDTMLKHWELYCELEKSLGFQASIYTNEPYYKFERKSDDMETFFRYCGKDSAITYEILSKLTPKLTPTSQEHYLFNVQMLNPLLYMELRGIRYDIGKARSRREELLKQSYVLQHELNTLTGHGLQGRNSHELEGECRAVMCYKRNSAQPKKEYVKTLERALELCRHPNLFLQPALMGELSVLAESELNVDSPKQMSNYLYGSLKLPEQYNNKDGLTTDYEALLKLKKTKTCQEGSQNRRIVDLCLEIRSLNTRSGMLGIKADGDGRIRCGYNVVGTETGRLTCYTSPTGSGYNLQTIPNYTKPEDAPGKIVGDRDLFIADEGMWFFQCDLSGADGWTVAAHSKHLGEPTMLDDLLFGIKPAKVLCLGLRGNSKVLAPTFPRDELKELCEGVKKEDWDYFACKIGQHGTSYLMGPIKLARQIFEESEGKVDLTSAQAKDLQRLFLMRYRGITLWHQFSQRQIAIKPILVSASGHRRVFFGRREDILSDWLAHEPQNNTTYATNLAALKLWKDPENRMSDMPQGHNMGPSNNNRTPEQARLLRLRVEPLHQVHDALCGQFRKEDTSWAVGKIKSYFDITLIIAGQKIKIPFEGLYGPSWGELGPKYGGGVI